MKKFIYIAISLLFFTSCQEVIDVDLESSAPRLVIDAGFEVYSDNLLFAPQNGVKLSLSAPFFDDSVPAVSDAEVFITNLNDGTIINFEESLGEEGFFIVENGEEFNPEFDMVYELTVIYNEQTYTAETEFIPAVPIDSLTQGDGVLFNGDEIEVIIEFTDEPIREDFYLFDLDFDLFLLSEDTFYQGQTFNFSYFYERNEFMPGNDITIKIQGVDEAYYNYFNLILEQSEQDGNPFQTPPALVRGNIINTTNQDDFAFGYFRISQSYTSMITVDGLDSN